MTATNTMAKINLSVQLIFNSILMESKLNFDCPKKLRIPTFPSSKMNRKLFLFCVLCWCIFCSFDFTEFVFKAEMQ